MAVDHAVRAWPNDASACSDAPETPQIGLYHRHQATRAPHGSSGDPTSARRCSAEAGEPAQTCARIFAARRSILCAANSRWRELAQRLRPAGTSAWRFQDQPKHQPRSLRSRSPRPSPSTGRGAFWWFVRLAGAVLAAGLVAAAVYVVSAATPATYQSSSTVRVSVQAPAGSTDQSVIASNDLASQYAQIVAAERVLRAAGRRLSGDDADLGGKVSRHRGSAEPDQGDR